MRLSAAAERPVPTAVRQHAAQPGPTTTRCPRRIGAGGLPSAGHPQVVPSRWINPADGTVTRAASTTAKTSGRATPAAQVTFAHRRVVDTTGADAGIVHSLPGQPGATTSWCAVQPGHRLHRREPSGRPAGVYPVPLTRSTASSASRSTGSSPLYSPDVRYLITGASRASGGRWSRLAPAHEVIAVGRSASALPRASCPPSGSGGRSGRRGSCRRSTGSTASCTVRV